MRLLLFLIFFIIAFVPKGFSQKERKDVYLENTISPFNIISQPASGFKPGYWMRGSLNSIMVKAGLNTKHVFRLGFSDYGEILSSRFSSNIINNDKIDYLLSAYDLRFGYQYNYNNDKRRTVPFLCADYLHSYYDERHVYIFDRQSLESTKYIAGQGLLFSMGIKQKVKQLFVINIESGIFFGRFKSNGTHQMQGMPIGRNDFSIEEIRYKPQFYPIKISLGVRLWDNKNRKT